MQPLLTQDEAAELLKLSVRTIERLRGAGTGPKFPKAGNRITTDALVKYVKTFRGLEYATDESIASFLYKEMGFRPELAPQGNRFRASKGGARGWEFPPLLELRNKWETLFGGQWDWHNPEIDEWQAQPSLLERSAKDF